MVCLVTPIQDQIFDLLGNKSSWSEQSPEVQKWL